MREKVVGYFLLAFSIIVIIGITVNVYFVFTGRLSPVNVFKPLTTSSLLPIPPEAAVLEKQNGGGSDLSVGLNIFAHLALMSFMASAGFKIGRLGVMMVRPIKVNLNQEK
ncbi:MAG: hypothetical protein ACOYJ8_02050 [Patescibacteria group bacterium]|jgi:hypothetical protein